MKIHLKIGLREGKVVYFNLCGEHRKIYAIPESNRS